MNLGRCCLVLLVGCATALVMGCEDVRPGPVCQTGALVSEFAMALDSAVRQGFLVFDQLPANLEDGDALNAYLTHFLVDKEFLDVGVLRDRRRLRRLNGDQDECCVDAWGRPVIIQIPALFPKGLTYSTSQGSHRIAPLPNSIWTSSTPPAVQVWSLGPNGLDDRGKGDDIIGGHDIQ